MDANWLTPQQAAEQWGITVRQVQWLCSKDKIKGVTRLGQQWLIPKGTPKPVDGRTKAAKSNSGIPISTENRDMPNIPHKITIQPKVINKYHFFRPRINTLLDQAVNSPLTIVCAGTGYGKTRAVSDFISQCKIPTAWVQLSENDNIGSRFWENYIYSLTQLDKETTYKRREIDFPDTDDKLHQYIEYRSQNMPKYRHIVVLDDFHLITNPAVIRYFEYNINNDLPSQISFILISRNHPQINFSQLLMKDFVRYISEKDLIFNESELKEYLNEQGIHVEPQTIQDILHDTSGWAFSMNLVAQSLKRSPGYSGYTRKAIKQNIFSLTESELWNKASDSLKHFLVRLSLIEHLPADLINTLAGEDQYLLSEFMQKDAFIRYDNYTNVYLIHNLCLDYLHTKQNILSDKEKRDTYKAAAIWCVQNNFKVDALGYYEKAGDYDSIVSVCFSFLFYLSYDLAFHMVEIFNRIPKEMFYQIDCLAAMHLRAVINLGNWQETIKLADYYEQKFLILFENNILRKHNLGLIYYFRGIIRFLMSTSDGKYDFDLYFLKMDKCLSDTTILPDKWLANNLGPWANNFGSAAKNAPFEYREAAIRMIDHINNCMNGTMAGLDELSLGEIYFYQGNMTGAEPFMINALKSAMENRQFDTAHRALLYIIRIAFSQAKLEKIEQALEDTKALLDEKDYSLRFITYDISLSFYYYILRQPEMIPIWLKEKFSPYGHSYSIENFGNQIKVRYHYLIKNYHPLLIYINEMKQRESVLYGRVELLAIEACVHFQMKNKNEAFDALRAAYENAIQNDILIPFVELGKDMRTLATAALSHPDCGIPKPWLEEVKRKSSTYAKNQSFIISEYKKANGINDIKSLTNREREVLRDLNHGLSRSDIAANQNLAVGTVNSIINNICTKLNVQSTADIVRIKLK